MGASHHLAKQLRQAMRFGKLFGGKGRLLAGSAEERSKDTKLALRRDSRKLRMLRVSLGLEPGLACLAGEDFQM